MTAKIDLNENDADALLRHCESYKPDSGDPREDARLRDALETIRQAITTAQAQA